MNLILNAAESIDERGGRVEVRTFVRDVLEGEDCYNALGYAVASGRYIGLQVSDTGCGMDEKTRAKIFEPFFTTKFTGRGLGLAAVQGIVRTLQGLIAVSSVPDEGSVFTVLLPVREVPPVPTAGSEPVHPAGQATILVIDDEEIVRATTRAALERAGYSVLLADGGVNGIKTFHGHRDELDLILLDLGMPGKSGIEVLREIRQTDSSVPVVIASGYSEEEVARQFDGVMISGIVQKPFTSARLVEGVAKVLAGRNGSGHRRVLRTL
jgi:CheY-like chemotaxis protein